MQLSNEQADAARALGCRFIAATEAQVRQFSMQRRVFTIEGKPFLAARQDGFYETAGTLQALIADVMRRKAAPPAQEPAADSPVEQPVAEEEPVADARPAPQDAEAEDEAAENEAADDVAIDDEMEDEVAEKEQPAAQPPAPSPVAVVPARKSRPGAVPPVMAATVTIVRGFAHRGTLDTASLTELVASVHGTLQRLR